jgi:hypothetical protein
MYMIKRKGLMTCAILGLSAAMALAGCTLDAVETRDDLVRIPSDEETDQRLDDLGIICESTLNVTGSYVVGDAQPSDFLGCWPVGRWTFTASIDFQGCSPQPQITEEFVYDVTMDDDSNQIIVYTTDPDNERVSFKVSSEGDGLCHGLFDHYYTDGTVLTFRPTKQEDGSLVGFGAYSVFAEDPW